MAYADGCYVGKRVKLELLSADEVRQIHESTLDVIENVGVMFHSQNALDVLEANGATVDRETTVAKIPGEVVEKALAHGAARVHARRPHARVRPAARRRAPLHLLRRLRRVLPRPRDRRRALVAQGGPRELRQGRAGARQRLGHLGRRQRPGLPHAEQGAARVRRLRAQLGQAQHRRLDQGGLGGAQPDRDGRGPGRRPRRAAQAADLHRHHLHREPAPPGALRHGPGAHPGRGRHPGELLPHADPRRDRARSRSPARPWSTTPSS